jgi:hypothetical protein
VGMPVKLNVVAGAAQVLPRRHSPQPGFPSQQGRCGSGLAAEGEAPDSSPGRNPGPATAVPKTHTIPCLSFATRRRGNVIERVDLVSIFRLGGGNTTDTERLWWRVRAPEMALDGVPHPDAVRPTLGSGVESARLVVDISLLHDDTMISGWQPKRDVVSVS